MLTINLKRQPTKSKLYIPSTTTILTETEEICLNVHQLTIISQHEGIIIAGIPFGSTEFIHQFLQDKVIDIKNQLEIYMTTSNTHYSNNKHDSQTLYTILRHCISSQFTYLLRCCKPSDTIIAATKLDTIITAFITNITDSNLYIQNLSTQQLQTYTDNLFLPIQYGGCGLTSSVFIAKAAYIGSISLCAHWIGLVFPELIITNETNIFELTPSLSEFNNILNDFKLMMPSKLETITNSSIWEQPIFKIQHIISQSLYTIKSKELDASLPQETPITGLPANYNQEHIEAKVTRIQHISNKNKNVSAFLSANPACKLFKMNNPSFNIALQSRLNLPVNLSNKTTDTDALYCSGCSSPIDHLCTHTNHCSSMEIRAGIRSTVHKTINKAFIQIIKNTNEIITNWNILSGEPEVKNYFPSKTNHSTTLEENTENVQSNLNTVHRGDLAIQNATTGKTLFIDYTGVEPMSKYITTFQHATAPANQAANVKLKKYETLYDMKTTNTAEFFIFGFTSNGALSKDAIKLISLLTNHIQGITKQIIRQQIYQKLSSVIQTTKSDTILKIRKYYSSNIQPRRTIPSHIHLSSNNIRTPVNILSPNTQDYLNQNAFQELYNLSSISSSSSLPFSNLLVQVTT
jgi:hypothetical protein